MRRLILLSAGATMVFYLTLAATPDQLCRSYATKSQIARAWLYDFEAALELFRYDTGRCPTSQEGLGVLLHDPGINEWNGPYIHRLSDDPWGRPYEYRIPGLHGDWDLRSLGADGVEGGKGADTDVVSWEDGSTLSCSCYSLSPLSRSGLLWLVLFFLSFLVCGAVIRRLPK